MSNVRHWTLNQKLIIAILIVQILALILAGWEHFSTRANASHQSRTAAALIASSTCKGYDALEVQYLRQAKTTQEVERIQDFFRTLKAPINEALRTLDKPTCEERR